MTGFLGFAVFQKLRKTMPRSCLSQPTQPVRLCVESTPHSDQDTPPKSCGNSWKTKEFYRKKSMPASFPSSLVSMCLTINVPWQQTCPVSSSTHKVLAEVPLSLGQAHPPGPKLDAAAPQGRAPPQSLSMENSILKLLKINIGIITLHSSQATFVLKWNYFIFCLDILVGFSFLFLLAWRLGFPVFQKSACT